MPFGLYQFQRMSMSLENSVSTFQRLMQCSMNNLMLRLLLVYLYDILVYSSDFSSHMLTLEKIFKRLHPFSLKLNPETCRFCLPKVEFLGDTISAQGIVLMEDKFEVIRQATFPKNQTELRSFLYLASYYSRFLCVLNLLQQHDRCMNQSLN